MAKYDIHVEGVPPDEVVAQRCFTFGNYRRVLAVQGVQKMVNRFARCFMTPVGSDLSDATYGTTLAALFLGNISADDLSNVAAQAVADSEQKIREYDSQNGAPDSERLASATIDDIQVDPSGAGVTVIVTLKNAAGTSVQTAIPLPQE